MPFVLCRDALQRDLCNVNDVVMEIIHDPGRGVLLVKVVLRDTDKLNLRNALLMTVGGT